MTKFYKASTNPIHFLVTPMNPDSISRAMSVIGSRYAYYFNRAYKRTGTIWKGRHKSSLIQSDRYFLTCSRYIELNPVVAGMVAKPEEYRWSSYLVNVINGCLYLFLFVVFFVVETPQHRSL